MQGVKKEVWKGLAAITAAIFTIVMMAAPVAESYAGKINTALGISTTRIVSEEGRRETHGTDRKQEELP